MTICSITRKLLTGIAAMSVLGVIASVASAQNKGSMTGVVNDASGQPVAGAFVKVKNEQKRLTFMVISKEQGRFELNDLPPGAYRVQGAGGENQSQWSKDRVIIAAGEAVKVTLSLTERRGPALAPAWPRSTASR